MSKIAFSLPGSQNCLIKFSLFEKYLNTYLYIKKVLERQAQKPTIYLALYATSTMKTLSEYQRSVVHTYICKFH